MVLMNKTCTCRYGELGNAELVKKYGFALRQNPFTLVTLDKPRLLGAARRALGPARWRKRSALLRDQTEVLDEEEEPFEVSFLSGFGGVVGRPAEGLLYASVCMSAYVGSARARHPGPPQE